MSYILDALRRADAERDRGQIPGLNAQPGPAATSAEPRRPGMLALGLGVGLVLVLAAALAWWLWPRAAAPTPVVVQTVQPPVLLPPPAPAATPAPAAVPAPAPLPVVVSAPPPVAPAAPAVRPAAAVAAASAPPPLTLAELTPEQRRDWPPLQIGGVVHSDHPASRFVIVNGQLVHEGEEAAPGVTVERIGPRAAVLRWRGLRIAMPF